MAAPHTRLEARDCLTAAVYWREQSRPVAAGKGTARTPRDAGVRARVAETEGGVMLDPKDIDAVRAVVTELLTKPPVTEVILTLSEAKVYTKHATLEDVAQNADAGRTAFYAWCREFQVKSVGNGRYAKRHLDRALEREAGKRREQGRAEQAARKVTA